MITERKAIEEMLEDLRSEKRTLKANYRDDISQIEARQERLLERLERLDKIDRADIDAESTINELTKVADKLSDLIPHIPANILLEKTAEKMAAVNIEDAPQIFIEDKEKEEKEENQSIIKKEKKVGKVGIVPRPHSMKEILLAISDLLQDRHLSSKEIEKELKDKYRWEWGAFQTSLSNWRNKHPNIINKVGRKYSSAIHSQKTKPTENHDKVLDIQHEKENNVVFS
ncbi:hypothetical protein ABKP09_19910 [Peribacillus frigoritolerans]|uniref:hypothetical protein n=1 Tax=Peribacillus frigoritolerans TaxID=450367 RepID=UPI0032B38D06